MAVLPRCCSNSAMMPSHSLTSTRKKCDFSLVSMRGTPLPGSVRSTIALGLPLLSRAPASAPTTALMSLPSISNVSQPKARHLSATGSMSSTTGPSAWMPLQSISATSPSSLKWLADMAASQVEPSCISPSDSSTKTRAPELCEPQPERLADALAEAVAERAADHLDAGRGVERRHLQPAVVGAVGDELVDRDDAGLGQRRPQRDRIVSGRQQEAVALGPAEVVGVVAQLVEVERRQHVGDAEALADIALPLAARHGQHVAAKVRRLAFERADIGIAGRRISQHR